MAYTKIGWANSPSTSTPISAENLNHMDDKIENLDEISRYIIATATTNGDYKINSTVTIETGVKFNITFPTATNSASNARLSIDNGSNYYNIKSTNGTQLIALQIQKRSIELRFDGTDFIYNGLVILATTEFATNDFIGSKRIYGKMFSVAAFPNNTTAAISHGLTNTAIQVVDVKFYGRTTAGTYQIGGIDSKIRFNIIPTNTLQITTFENYSSFSGYVIMYYYYL